MEYRLTIEGGENIALEKEYITNAIYRTDTPGDSNARSTEVGSELRITGRITKSAGSEQDDATKKLILWSLVPAVKPDCYRKVTLEVISAGQAIRNISLPNAFVVDYTEDYGANQGVGIFNLVVRQKKDKIESISIEGGYAID